MKTNHLTHLLSADLKSRKLSQVLHSLGVEECPWLPSLSEPIAEALGLRTDEGFKEYDILMDDCALQIENPHDVKAMAEYVLERMRERVGV